MRCVTQGRAHSTEQLPSSEDDVHLTTHLLKFVRKDSFKGGGKNSRTTDVFL